MRKTMMRSSVIKIGENTAFILLKTMTKQLLKSYLNKNMKIKLTDGRILIGIFLCTDKDANVILGSCAEHLKDETVDEPR